MKVFSNHPQNRTAHALAPAPIMFIPASAVIDTLSILLRRITVPPPPPLRTSITLFFCILLLQQ